MTELLRVKNLRTGFRTENGLLPVIHGISFHVNQGEIVGVVGESGSGKSVTSLSIMRLFHDTPGEIMDGEVLYKGENLFDLTEKRMKQYRGNEISMIFQEPMTSLNPVLKIGKQMRETIELHLNMPKKEAHQYAIKTLKSVGIPRAEDLMDEYPHQLSGGMRQRVIIAMQISCNPSLLIADEPTTALDVTIQAQILNLMKEIQVKTNMGILFITHDLGVVAEICDRVIVMYAGKIVEEATVEELFAQPKHPYTKGLIESVPKIGMKSEKLYSIPGTVPNPTNMPKGCKFAPRCEHAMAICHKKEPALMTVNHHATRCWLYDEEMMKDKQGEGMTNG
ncbi:ABC transporter ATP-binding protein [Pseudogracilibacillus auburnensis]|uniref:Peptide/nickel transport system ATP-binding protein/oligopeptide transport system ATP-binding protein n=1 Tax=Pseudogracilibacillus auburnensis TaxID=1494959 RepID=A0A2V3VNG5_9BACI|nr:ABC transporter ATP-binding protein [Pseudogracilibacillus auburnensis]PXW83336.1 peptide/nickel transport system ATP-binding protein/oligopeptide transport system ATP-binding protein [Pseudogracilibacillus auburnensis]